MNDTYRIAFYREQFDTAKKPRWPAYIAIISPGKQPEQARFIADHQLAACVSLDTDRLLFTYPDELLLPGGADNPFDDPLKSFHTAPPPHPDPTLTTYRLAVYANPRHYEGTHIALLAPDWRPEDAKGFSDHHLLQVIDLKQAELPVPDAYTNELLHASSAIEAHQRKMARFDAAMFQSPDDLSAQNEHLEAADRQIIEAERCKGGHLVEKLYGDTTADRAIDAIHNQFAIPQDNER
jgi:hypothetical protein